MNVPPTMGIANRYLVWACIGSVSPFRINTYMTPHKTLILKSLLNYLTPLDAIFTKNRGVGTVMVN